MPRCTTIESAESSRPVRPPSLRLEIVHAVGRRIIPGALGNVVLLMATLVATRALTLHAVVGSLALSWMTVLSCWRIAHARTWRTVEEVEAVAWLREYSTTTVLAGLTWGLVAGWWLAVHGLQAGAVIVLVTVAGTTTAAMQVSAPRLTTLRSFVVAALVPPMLVLLLVVRSVEAAALFVTLACFFGFTWVEGKAMNADFLTAKIRAYRLQRRSAQLRDSREALRVQAMHDSLTGVLNRAAGLHALEHELERAERERNEVSVLVADIDFFKRINDNFGHAGGDEALRTFVGRMRAHVRSYDVLARLGGEEFLLVLPSCGLLHAAAVAERLRRACAGEQVSFEGGAFPMTCSFGVATARTGEAPAALVSRADAALYRAKRSGRDTVQLDGDPNDYAPDDSRVVRRAPSYRAPAPVTALPPRVAHERRKRSR